VYELAFRDVYGLKPGVFWREQYTPLAAQQPFYGELAIKRSNDHLAVSGINGTVNDQQVTIVDASTDHRFTVGAQKKRGRLVTHKVLVQVKPAVKVILGR
jgi:hypothetical protein